MMTRTARPRRTTLVIVVVAAAAATLALLPAPSTADNHLDPPPEAVVLARSDEPADALAAGPVAGILGAPVLLTPSASLLDSTAQAITAIDPDLVILAGGTAALSAEVEAAVAALGVATRRVAGADRHETAASIAELLAEFSTGRPVLTGTAVTDQTIPGLTAADADRLGGMTPDELADRIGPGPQGPQGEPGPPGPRGPAGAELGEIVMSHPVTAIHDRANNPVDIEPTLGIASLRHPDSSGIATATLPLTGPATIGGIDYALAEVRWCVHSRSPQPGTGILPELFAVAITSSDDTAFNGRTTDPSSEVGCETFAPERVAPDYTVEWAIDFTRASQTFALHQVSSRWVPVDDLGTP